MLPPTMSRFGWMTMGMLLMGILALALGSLALFIAGAAVFLAGIGLGVAFPQLRLFGPFVCRGVGDQRQVALTFDDGPDPRSTPVLLDLLREAGVPAAFFAVGSRVEAHPELSARIVREGHLLENHSYAHSNFTNFFGSTRLKTELQRAQSAIREATGVAPRCYRPPMGLSNPRVFTVARALGLEVIGWSARGLDTILHNPDRVVARIVRRLRPGAILLLHDGNIPAERLVLTVRRLLASLDEHDYEIVRLDQLLK